MSLNIREAMIRAVIQVVRERYERLQRRRGEAAVEELRAIAERAAHAELLCDEHGLPK